MALLVQMKDNVVVYRFSESHSAATIGRLQSNDVCIDSQEVSGEHAVIERDGDNDGYRIRDLGSTNRTFVNEKPIQQVVLRHNDVIRVGWAVFRFQSESRRDHGQTSQIKKSWIPGVYYSD